MLMDMASIHISVETKQMLQEEFGHIRVIMIPPHTTSFLLPCDVGLMRHPSTTTPMTSALSSPANIVRLIETGVHALEPDRRFEFAWKHLRSNDEVWGPLLDDARQLHAAGQLFENVREEQEEVPEMVAMLAEP